MGDGRTYNCINESQAGKVVAKLDDILFIPKLADGNKFLKYRYNIIQNLKTEWEDLYGLNPPVSETDDIQYLESLDPVAWKEQDHYAVIGLGHLRIRATEDDIRKAYRYRCLKHHPDKRMAAGQFIPNPDGDYFACIVKAFDILGTSLKRRSYDSVDPKFDDYIPPKTIKDCSQFFKVYGKWFYLNSQWSQKLPVPLLGDIFTCRDDVEKFYDFWYSFDSWREYSYLDEEDKEKGADREERRWIDKQNKAARAKLKKEEMSRIRQVVDNAYACDPRIKQFKEDDRLKKMEIKESKRRILLQKQMEEENARREIEAKERELRDKEEAEAKAKEIIIKKEKETLKKALKKERKNFRTVVSEHNYFAADDNKTLMKNMSLVEELCEVLSLENLEILNQNLTGSNVNEAVKIFEAAVKLHTKNHHRENGQFKEQKNLIVVEPEFSKSDSSVSDRFHWSVEEQKLLEQALKTFPSTDPERWTNIASCIPGKNKKECLARFKELAALVKAKKAQKPEGRSSSKAL